MERLKAGDGDEDLFVVIVGDGDDDNRKRRKQLIIEKKEIENEAGSSHKPGVEGLIETAEMYGELIPIEYIKEDPDGFPEYLDASGSEEIKCEFVDGDTDDNDPDYIPDDNDQDYIPDDNDQDYIPDDNDQDDDEEDYSGTEMETEALLPNQHYSSAADKEKHRYKMRRPEEQQSFIKELQDNYPELATDKDMLVDTLCECMLQIKPPPLPQDYFIMNGINFECTTCGSVKETLPAIGRHWQEKHGPRYLVCYACGVDFRSKTNLYKHEMRCRAPDAVMVLKARARFVGRKGRSRPFLPPASDEKNQRSQKDKKPTTYIGGRFRCDQCPAEYMTKQSLQSHLFAHEGERPFKCPQCDLAYTSATALSRHQKSKHGNDQFICTHCMRSFTCKGSLKQHLNTHRTVRRFECELCGRRFAQKLALQLHVDKIHYKLPPPCACQVCPKRYPRMSLLKTHMLRAHGMNLITRNMFYKALPHLSETQLQQARIVMKTAGTQGRLMYEVNDLFKNKMKTKSESEIIIPDMVGEEEEISETPQDIKDTVQTAKEAPDMPQINDQFEEEQTEMATDDEQEQEQTENDAEENISDEQELPGAFLKYVRKFQDGEINDNTKMIIIQDGQVICVDDTNMHLYADDLNKLEMENSNKEEEADDEAKQQLEQTDENGTTASEEIEVPQKKQRKLRRGKVRKGLR